MSQSRRLLLIAPGLLGPVTDPEAVASLLPSIPPLDRMLARADGQDDVDRDFPAAVFAAFAVGGRGLPVAAVSRLGETGGGSAHVGEYYWLRADPVHLRIDTHNARLFGNHLLELEADESNALIERLRSHFGEDGLHFEAPVPGRWYVAVNENFDLDADSPQHVAGRNIDSFLPTGADAGRWRQWMNEAQMLLHDAPENLHRESEGRLPVNSFWPWGGGRLPVGPFETVPDAAWSDEPLVHGLARLAGLSSHPLPGSAFDWQPVAGDNLIVYSQPVEPLVHGDIEGWLETVDRFANEWVKPLCERVAAGELDAFTLSVGGQRRFHLRPAHRRRWWRRRHPWTRWLEHE